MGEAKNREAAQAAAQSALANQQGETRTLRLTPQQLAILLVFEGQAAQLQVGANQLGQFIGLTEAADVLISAMDHIGKAKVRLQAEWSRAIHVAQPADVPRLIQP